MKNKNIETGSENRKKPIYKRKWFIAIVIIVVAVVAVKISGNKDVQKIEWSKLELGNKLPKPPVNTGTVNDDTDEILRVDLKKVSEDEYKKYVKSCEKKGYTVDSDKSSYSYEAYDGDGYKLRISNTGDNMDIELEAPMALTDITWPASAAGSMLPVPKSAKGKFSYENESGFSVYIGDTSIEDYAAYVQECSDKGFNVDYSKNEKNYSADNAEGYHVSIQYEGNNTMQISISSPDNNAADDTEVQSSETGDESSAADSSELRDDFKNAMDSYEAFMNQYVEFMKKYNSNPGDAELISEYADYLEKYNTFAEDFAKWQNNSMNQAEAAYYVEVQTRVNDKLAEVVK